MGKKRMRQLNLILRDLLARSDLTYVEIAKLSNISRRHLFQLLKKTPKTKHRPSTVYLMQRIVSTIILRNQSLSLTKEWKEWVNATQIYWRFPHVEV